jgi:hypothetical protein
MKHPYLCACLTFALSVTAYHSGVRLNAAELWNATGTGASSPSSSYYVKKKEDRKGQSETYYNATRKFNPANRTELFNSQDQTKVSSGEGGLDSAIYSYKNVKMGKQRDSKQFKTMSANAVANRQADIDHALQIEYDTRKATARNRIEVAKRVDAARAKFKRDRQTELAAMQSEEETKAMERERKKARALGRTGAYRTSNSGVKYKTKDASSKDLKKPTRLFNDPNK